LVCVLRGDSIQSSEGAIYVAKEPASVPSGCIRKLAPGIDFPVRPPRTVKAAFDVRGLRVVEVKAFVVMTGVATRARGAGGGRLQTNELAAPVQDEVAAGEKSA